MSNPAAIDTMMAQLARIRERFGEVAYTEAAEGAARELLGHPELADITREVLKDVVDFKKIDATPKPAAVKPSATMDQVIAQQVKQQMPGLKTQAQFETFMAAFNSLRLYMNHTFLGEKAQADQAKEVLLLALDNAAKATELSEKLGEVPEAATSPEAEKYKSPPKEFGELEVQQSLLEELKGITAMDDLTQWYLAAKVRFDSVVSLNYRNELYDAIRAKKADLRTIS